MSFFFRLNITRQTSKLLFKPVCHYRTRSFRAMMNTTDTNNEEKQTPTPTGPEYNFGVGHPSISLNLPSELIAKCVVELSSKDNVKDYNDTTGYAISEGSWRFRSNLSDWLNKLNAMNKYENDKKYSQTSGTNMIVTTGASQSMELLLIHLKTLKNKTNANCKNIVLCADPSYFLFPNIVETANCKLLPIPFINNSLDFNYLQSILELYNNDIICFYIIPSHQNPLGISYNINDKIALIKLCHKYKLHVIADEVYNLLSFDADTMMIPFLSSIEKTLVSQEKEEKEREREFFCHSISSFSKIIGPGFRVGWILSHNANILKLINNHGSIISGGNMANFVPSLLAYLLDANVDENDMTKHLIKVRNELSAKCKCLCDTIRKYDTQNVIKFNEPKGGYFVWLQLPMDKIKIISHRNGKVKYFDGKKLSSTFGPISKNIQFLDESDSDNKNREEYFDGCIRLCFAFLDQQQIRDGVRLFVQSIYND